MCENHTVLNMQSLVKVNAAKTSSQEMNALSFFIYLFNPEGKYSRVSSTPVRGDPPEYVCI